MCHKSLPPLSNEYKYIYFVFIGKGMWEYCSSILSIAVGSS